MKKLLSILLASVFAFATFSMVTYAADGIRDLDADLELTSDSESGNSNIATLQQVLSDYLPNNELDTNDGIWMNIVSQNITDEHLSNIVTTGGIPQYVIGLNLENNLITDISPLMSLIDLKYLCLCGNPITQEQINELQEALPHLAIKWDNNLSNRSGNTLLQSNSLFQSVQSRGSQFINMETSGIGWSAGTNVTFGFSNGIINNVSVNLSSSSSILVRVNKEGTTRPYPFNPNTANHIVVSYFTASSTTTPVWSVWCHTINLNGDGGAWGWAAEYFLGSVPVTY